MQTGLTRGDRSHNDERGDARRLDEYLRKSTAVPSSSSSLSSSDPLGWQRKNLEVNPRIRFNHRGQVAAAFPLKDTNNNDDDTSLLSLRYQFFITLDESPFLDGHHVVFGTVAGPTVFNALRIAKTETDETTGAPVDMIDSPPRITSVKIDYHPFEDLVVSKDSIVPWRVGGDGNGKGGRPSEAEKRRKKRKGKRDLNVLSFGDEERRFEMESGDDERKIQSSHDVLHGESEVLSSSVDDDLRKRVEGSAVADIETKVKRTNDEDGTSEQNKRKKIKTVPSETVREPLMQETANASTDTTTTIKTLESLADKTTRQSKLLKPDEPSNRKKTKSIGAVEARRAKYLKGGAASLASKKERLKREDDTMAKLLAFRSKVLDTGKEGSSSSKRATRNGLIENKVDDSLASRMAKRVHEAREDEAKATKEKEDFIAAPGYHGQVVVEDNDNADNNSMENNHDWLSTKFKCKRHIDHDSRVSALEKGDINGHEEGGDGRHMDDYLVVDEKKKSGSHSKKHRNSSHSSDHRRHHDHHGS